MKCSESPKIIFGRENRKSAYNSYIVNGLSINDVTHFLRFLTPPSPLSPILLNRLMELCHLLADPPKWVTLFMDGPNTKLPSS